jgi:hypothetical protein
MKCLVLGAWCLVLGGEFCRLACLVEPLAACASSVRSEFSLGFFLCHPLVMQS